MGKGNCVIIFFIFISQQLVSQPLQYLTLKTNLLDPLNIGLDIPISKRYSLDCGYSYSNLYISSDQGNRRNNLRMNVRREFGFKKNANQLSKYIYSGFRYRTIAYSSGYEGFSQHGDYAEEGLLKALYISIGVGVKGRTLQGWIGFDQMIYNKENILKTYKYYDILVKTVKWKPNYWFSAGFALNIWNINRPRNNK